MVKCPQNHTVRKQAAKNDTKCDGCAEVLNDGVEAYRCAKCDYDLCSACFHAKKVQKPVAKGSSLVKQGLLKEKKGSGTAEALKPTGSSSSTPSEAYQAFAFSGFPAVADPNEIYNLVKEYVYDYLGEFSLKVLGTVVSEGVAHVGVGYKASDSEALDKKVYDMRDYFIYDGSYLNTVLVQHPEVFKQPTQPSSTSAAMAVDALGAPGGLAGGPQSWPAPPGVATYNVATPAPAPFTQLSPQIAEAKQRLHAMRAALAEVPPLPAGEAEKGPEDAEGSHPTNADLMAKLDSMMGAMALKEDVQVAQLEVVKQLRAEFRTEFEPLRAQAEQTESKVNQALDETKALNNRLAVVENAIPKMEAIEKAIPSLDLERPRADWSLDAADPAYRSVGVFGWDDSDGLTARKTKIDEFMASNFPKVSYAISFEYKYPRKQGKMKPSCAITVLTRDEADEVLKQINSQKYKIQNGKGKDIKFDKPRTALQKARWAAMKRAEEQLKKDGRTNGREVKLESQMPVRKVLVGGVLAFEQTKEDAIGMFVGEFKGMKLHERER